VVSRDGNGAAILIFFKDQIGDDEASPKQRDDRLEEIIAREQGPEQLYLTGTQHIGVNSLALMRRDLRTFTPLSLAVVLMILGICFRNVRGVILPLIAVTCGVLWTLGIMVLTGESITIGTLVLPTLPTEDVEVLVVNERFPRLHAETLPAHWREDLLEYR
jgi:uncharacterized protein